MSLDCHIERVLWTQNEISERVSSLASEITSEFATHSPPPLIIGVATGAFLFLADLVRLIPLPLSVDFIRSDSYGSSVHSSAAPQISLDLKLHVRDKHVILVEDIVDTGYTLSSLISHLTSKGASSVSVCTFLDKPARRKVEIKLVGDGKYYRGFEAEVARTILTNSQHLCFAVSRLFCGWLWNGLCRTVQKLALHRYLEA